MAMLLQQLSHAISEAVQLRNKFLLVAEWKVTVVICCGLQRWILTKYSRNQEICKRFCNILPTMRSISYGLLFYLFLQLIQIHYIFSDHVHNILYLHSAWNRLEMICNMYIYTHLYTCLMSITRFALREKVTLRLLKLLFQGVDVVEGAGRKAKRMVLQCINGVGSNPVEGRIKI